MNDVSTALGKLGRTRTLFANWLKKNRSVSLLDFLNLELEYQIGIYTNFLRDNNIIVAVYWNSYDVYVIDKALVIENSVKEYDEIAYLHYHAIPDTKRITNNYDDLIKDAFQDAFAWLNVNEQKEVPWD